MQATTTRNIGSSLNPALSETIVPLSPEESRLLILRWANQRQTTDKARAGDTLLFPAPKIRPQRKPSAAPPRSTAEVMARLRHLVARQAAKERLMASFGRVRDPLAASEERNTAWRPQSDVGGSLDDLLQF